LQLTKSQTDKKNTQKWEKTVMMVTPLAAQFWDSATVLLYVSLAVFLCCFVQRWHHF